MNFFWKLYFSIMLIVTVCFGIGGYVLIQSSFHTSLDREIEVAFQENDILYISFERILSTIYGIDSATILEKDMLASDEGGTLASDFNTMSLKLLQTMDNLKETATRQEMFAGNFAHELKTPLTSMIGYADMLRSKKLTEEQQVLFANQIVQDGKRLESLSMKLMDLIVLKREDLPMRRVSSKQFFQSVYQTVLPVMQQNHIRFTVKCQYALLTIEPDLMATVCINLLDNARKAIDEGQKGEISLLGRRCDDGYEILVIDNGCGMEQEELAKITEAFYMVDKSRSRKKGGAGLGLAVCSEILRLHGGLLEFVSQPGQGTCARVWLRGEHLHAEA